MENGECKISFLFSVLRFPLFTKSKSGSTREPLLLLVNQVVLFRAEAWENRSCACAVAALGYNLVNIHFWSRIAQNIFLHNVYEI